MIDYRRARATMIARELNIDTADLPKLLDKYAATATKTIDSDAHGYLQTFPTFTEACSDLGDGALEGYLPAGVYDLDTGDLIELHVSTPIVTRSEDQNITRNPLQSAFRCPSGHTWNAPIVQDAKGKVILAEDHDAFCPSCEAPGDAL